MKVSLTKNKTGFLVKLLNMCLTYSVLNKTAPPALIDIDNLTMHPESHNTKGNSLGLLNL